MAGEDDRGVGIKFVVSLAGGLFAIAALIAAGVGSYSGREGAQQVLTPAMESFDAKVNAARIESERRRDELREDFTERRREVEARLHVELERIGQLHEDYRAEMERALDEKADEAERREALEHIYDEISRTRDRLERMEVLVYGRPVPPGTPR